MNLMKIAINELSMCFVQLMFEKFTTRRRRKFPGYKWMAQREWWSFQALLKRPPSAKINGRIWKPDCERVRSSWWVASYLPGANALQYQWLKCYRRLILWIGCWVPTLYIYNSGLTIPTNMHFIFAFPWRLFEKRDYFLTSYNDCTRRYVSVGNTVIWKEFLGWRIPIL